MNKQVQLKMPLEVVEKLLRNALKASGEPHAHLVAEQIIYHLEATEMGLSSLLMAFMGHKETTDWIIGDECLVDPGKIYSWNCNKDKMKETGMYHKEHIKGRITGIDFRKKKAIKFEFDGLDGSNPDPVKMDQELEIQDIRADKDLVLVRPNLGGML